MPELNLPIPNFEEYRETKASTLRRAEVKAKREADEKAYEKKKKNQLKYQME